VACGRAMGHVDRFLLEEPLHATAYLFGHACRAAGCSVWPLLALVCSACSAPKRGSPSILLHVCFYGSAKKERSLFPVWMRGWARLFWTFNSTQPSGMQV
jgi:hypothetical protein